ncbi:hypothetical protein DFJ58DRAFT_656496, partial [Suillus subalutaceus]|uniref:uncharacterized protein n=1 Tax=Suillus subalutaceus TaxID=48586 RepID=UPI001B875469
WNKSAAKVFARDFIHHDYICKDYELVQDKFLTHIKGLKSRLALETKQESARESKRKAVSKREQKRGVSAKPNLGPLFEIHLNTVAQVGELHPHLDILSYLGVDGMSSDELAHEDGRPQFRVLRKPWRNVALTRWLHIIDAMYCHNKYSPASRSVRGNPFCVQFESTRVGGGRAVPRLPKNTYDPRWLEGLDSKDKEILGAVEDEYDFSHTP